MFDFVYCRFELRAILELAVVCELVVRKLAADGTPGDRFEQAANIITEGQTYVMAFAPIQPNPPSADDISTALQHFWSRMTLHALQKEIKGRTTFSSYAAICKASSISLQKMHACLKLLGSCSLTPDSNGQLLCSLCIKCDVGRHRMHRNFAMLRAAGIDLEKRTRAVVFALNIV